MSAPVKAFLLTETGDRIDCLFNPAELTVQKTNNWTAPQSKGKTTPQLRFQAGLSGQLTVELVFDTTDTGDPVTDYTNQLFDLMKADDSLQGANQKNNSARPPWVEFHWGDLHSFRAVLASLSAKFTYFASDGTPLRARCNVTLKQYEEETPAWPQNPTSGTPFPHSVHQVVPGETLDRIAAQRYGDPARWRTVADANGVVDPLEIPPGTTLVLPDPEAASRG